MGSYNAASKHSTVKIKNITWQTFLWKVWHHEWIIRISGFIAYLTPWSCSPHVACIVQVLPHVIHPIMIWIFQRRFIWTVPNVTFLLSVWLCQIMIRTSLIIGQHSIRRRINAHHFSCWYSLEGKKKKKLQQLATLLHLTRSKKIEMLAKFYQNAW